MAGDAQAETPNKSEEQANQPLPLQLELPLAPQTPAGVRAATPTRARTRMVARILLFACAVGLIALVGDALVGWLLPWYVRRDCIERAAARGIELAIDEARTGRDGFRLIGVRAAFPAVGGLRAQAAEVDVETNHLHVRRLVVRGAELNLNGSFASIESALGRWQQATQTAGDDANSVPSSVSIEAAHILWQAPIGDNLRAEAADVHCDVRLKGRGPDIELHASSERVTFATPWGPMGPWRVDVDRIPGSSRTRIALDPGVPESCTILLVGDGTRTTSFDIVVPRSPVGHLGLPAQWLGPRGSSLQFETTLHYVTLGPARADANVRGGIYGVELAGLPGPVDVVWEASVSGNPTAGIDVKKARLAFGPLLGPLSGTLKRFDDGFRIDLASDLASPARPIPCAAFGAPLGRGLPLKNQTVRATLRWAFDSRDWAATRMEFAPDFAANPATNSATNIACGSGLF